MKPATLPPPGNGAIPNVPERLPVLSNEWRALRAMIQGAVSANLGNEDMKVVCYLIRRAHGMGLMEGRHSRV